MKRATMLATFKRPYAAHAFCGTSSDKYAYSADSTRASALCFVLGILILPVCLAIIYGLNGWPGMYPV